MRVRTAVTVIGTVLGLLLAGAAPGPAAADAMVQTVRIGGPLGDELVPLTVDGLYPGSAEVGRFVLERGPVLAGGRFAVEVTDLADYERGCNRPEIRAGDTTCGDGPDQGELSRQLLLGAAWAPVDGCATAPPPADGTVLRELEDVVLTAPAELSEADGVCLVLAAVLPASADNLVQTDLVQFDLRLGLTDAQQTDVLGQPFERPVVQSVTGALTPTPRTLPFTGLPLLAISLWALLCASLGWVLICAARPTRSHRRPVTDDG